MKRSALALVICLVFVCASYAQQDPQDQPASKEDIQRYMDVVHSRDLLVKEMQAVKTAMHQMTHDQMKDEKNLPPDFEARMDKMMDDAIDKVPIDDLLNLMAPVYQRHFTKGDVDALVAFYSGPTGQKVLNEMPAITAEAMTASSGLIQKMMADMQDKVQGQIAQVQKQKGAATQQN